jgi:hypothetical protein
MNVYRTVAGLCWVPNFIAAEIILRATSSGDRRDGHAVREEQGRLAVLIGNAMEPPADAVVRSSPIH